MPRIESMDIVFLVCAPEKIRYTDTNAGFICSYGA